MYMDKDTSAQSACVSNDLLRRMVCGCNRSEIDVREAFDCEGRSKNCGYGKWGLENYPLASVFSPLQDFVKLYDGKTALIKGTVFEELDLPFMGESIAKGGWCNG